LQKTKKGLGPGNVERFANGSTNNNSNPDIDLIKKRKVTVVVDDFAGITRNPDICLSHENGPPPTSCGFHFSSITRISRTEVLQEYLEVAYSPWLL